MRRANPRHVIRTGAVMLLMLSLCAPVAAVDGVLEINQACVATGCFPNDAPGFPVTVGFGSYRLTSDLVVPDTNTTAINLIGIPITLDLNGFAIAGPFQCQATPPDCPLTPGLAIDGVGVREVVIRNGFIRSFGNDAVYLPGGVSRVEDLMIENIGGNGLVLSNGSVARNNHIRRTGGDGIQIASGGGDLNGLIEGNTVSATGGAGINAGDALVLGNNVQSFPVSAALGASAGYGLNIFSVAPTAGISFGNNVCANAVC